MDSGKLKDFKIIQAVLYSMIPLFLIIATGEVRTSISDYAYSSKPSFFVSLITMAGVLFFLDGYVDRKRFYNMILGGSLVGVAWTPHLDYPVLHYICAGIFFLGAMFFISYFSNKKERKWMLGFSFLMFLGLLGSFLGFYTLLIGEWIGMLVVCPLFILEAKGKIS